MQVVEKLVSESSKVRFGWFRDMAERVALAPSGERRNTPQILGKRIVYLLTLELIGFLLFLQFSHRASLNC